MDEKTLNNLKQFITTTVHQEIAGVRQEVADVHQEIAGVRQEVADVHQEIAGVHQEIAGVHQEIASLESKMNVRFDESYIIQNEILNTIGEIQESQSKAIRHQADVIDNHERRILKLEKRTA